jgi:beclin 1
LYAYGAGKNTYELYGPVNPFWSTRYDTAMICFLQCLQDFADFAKARDIAQNHSPPFELPYKLEKDKVDGKTIRYSFNRDDKWTAALKCVVPPRVS